MNQALTIAKKELRAFFLSPVALIFLATFLFLVLFSFFWVDMFFRRNLADIRPLFHWLPVLLIFLVSALAMRLWSDEQRTGTLEILFTLPVKISQLVAGKFLAGMGLVAVALILTLGLPITISTLGDLDWGPVIGGYVGALLLASTYLAIGLCVSATTDNPIVALIVSAAICGGFYLVGSDVVVSMAGNRIGEILGNLGTGSRFASIQRGVIDLRDLVYYGSLTLGFLFLNVVILEAKRWSKGLSTRARRVSIKLSAVLMIANLFVLNFAVAPFRTVRLDLTERNEYSISPVTKKLLGGLSAPLLIRGYFSAKTHPLLAPLVPQIRDLIAEYAAVGGDNVTMEFVDPQEDPAAEKEANEDYAIKSVPFQFADRHEAAVVNSYFTILIKYGDQHETLSFDELIEVNVTGMRDIEVKLRNLEYDLTRSIKKAVYGFKPLEELFASVPESIKLTAYMSPASLPENLKPTPARLEKIAEELKQRSGGKFSFEMIDPNQPGKENIRQDLFQRYGIRPMMTSLFGGDSFYYHLLMTSGERYASVFLTPDISEAELKTEVTAGLERLAPGFLKSVGVVLAAPPQPAQNPMMGMPPQGLGPNYRMIRSKLEENYGVKDVELKDGRVPGSIDVLVLIGGQPLDEKQRFAVDQFLMRGGSVVVYAGSFNMDLSTLGQGLAIQKTNSTFNELLGAWGVKIQDSLVLDPQNESFPVPVERNVMGLTVREIRMLKYPFWIDIRSLGMADESPIVAGIPAVTLQWASPLEISPQEGVTHLALLKSSPGSWTQKTTEVQPNFAQYPELGFGKADDAKTDSYVLGVSATGSFTSAFKGKASPLLAQDGNDSSAAEKTTGENKGVIERSADTARLVVIGSSEYLRDEVLGMSRQTGSDRFTNNLRLAENVLDWSVADVDLLSIRSRGTYARTLVPLDEAARTRWEFINYGIVIVALIAVVLATFTRRKKMRPIELRSAVQEG